MADEEQKERDPQVAERLRWIEGSRRHWKSFHNSITSSRKLAAGTATDRDGESQKINVAMATLSALMPHIYAKDPEIVGTPKLSVDAGRLKLVRRFGQVSAGIINHMYDENKLKIHAKRCLRSALSAKVGWIKQLWQRDYQTDPLTNSRIEDAQNEKASIDRMLRELENDAVGHDELRVKQTELQQLLAALEKNREVLVAEGLSLSTARPEHIILDPAIDTIEDWHKSRRVVELMPKPREEAEELCGRCLRSATARAYRDSYILDNGQAGSAVQHDPMVLLMEEWDRTLRTVFTYCEGMTEYVRDPYTPEFVSEIFYPWRPLWFTIADGDQMPMSLLELLDPLIDEYNETRKQQRDHREISKPHWIASSENPEENLRRYTDAQLGEVVIVDTGGRPLRDAIEVATPPPYNPAIYDTSAVRVDINEISGLQDAARGSVQKAKTATEAEILQAGLSGRADQSRDVTEEFLSDCATDGLQIAAQAMSQQQVAEIVGEEAAPAWPLVLQTRRNLFESTNMRVRAGTTGKPDQARDQQNWSQIFPTISELQNKMRELVAMQLSPEPEMELLRETLRRFDETIELEPFIPPEVLAFIEMQKSQVGAPVQPGMAPPGAPPDLQVVQ